MSCDRRELPRRTSLLGSGPCSASARSRSRSGAPVDLCCLEQGRASHRAHRRAPPCTRPANEGRSRRRHRRGASARPPNRPPSRRPPVASRSSRRETAGTSGTSVWSRTACKRVSRYSPCRSPRAGGHERRQQQRRLTDLVQTHRACALRSVPVSNRVDHDPSEISRGTPVLRSGSPSRLPRCQRRTSLSRPQAACGRDVGRGMHLSNLGSARSGWRRRIEHERPGRERACATRRDLGRSVRRNTLTTLALSCPSPASSLWSPKAIGVRIRLVRSAHQGLSTCSDRRRLPAIHVVNYVCRLLVGSAPSRNRPPADLAATGSWPGTRSRRARGGRARPRWKASTSTTPASMSSTSWLLATKARA